MHTLELFFTLSHPLPLHDSHLKTGFLNAELQANLARNKATKMNEQIQPYTKNPIQLSRTKHIEIRHHFVRELIENGTLTLEFIHTDDPKADLFTKPLDSKQFEFLCQNIDVISMD